MLDHGSPQNHKRTATIVSFKKKGKQIRRNQKVEITDNRVKDYEENIVCVDANPRAGQRVRGILLCSPAGLMIAN